MKSLRKAFKSFWSSGESDLDQDFKPENPESSDAVRVSCVPAVRSRQRDAKERAEMIDQDWAKARAAMINQATWCGREADKIQTMPRSRSVERGIRFASYKQDIKDDVAVECPASHGASPMSACPSRAGSVVKKGILKASSSGPMPTFCSSSPPTGQDSCSISSGSSSDITGSRKSSDVPSDAPSDAGEMDGDVKPRGQGWLEGGVSNRCDGRPTWDSEASLANLKEQRDAADTLENRYFQSSEKGGFFIVL